MLHVRKSGAALSPLWVALGAAAAASLWCVPAMAQASAAAPCHGKADTVEVTDFGAKGDGTTDNVKAFRDALAYAARCSVAVIHIPAGKYMLVPHGPSAGIQLPSNIALTGEGMANTVLQVAGGTAGANFDSLFWARNQDRIELKDLGLIGNNQVVNGPQGRPLNTYGAALSITIDKEPGTPAYGTPKNLSHFLVANCNFENFNAAAWIRVINYSDNYSIDGIDIRDNRFLSREGNAVNPNAISFTSNAMEFMGSVTSKAGLVTNVNVTHNVINATHIKGGIAVWTGVRGIRIVNNTISDAGADPAIQYDKGAYAITVYGNFYYYDKDHPQGARHAGLRPDDVHIERNVILRPKSCGIYSTSAKSVYIVGNKISGQSDAQNGTLPKGAIVASYSMNTTVQDNEISNSHIGMSLLGGEHFRINESNNAVSGTEVRAVTAKGPPPPLLTQWAKEDE